MTAEESWATAMRAEALAKLLLTQRDELEVLDASQTVPRAGYDLLVRIYEKGISPAPEFAVEVKGTRKDLTPGEMDRIVREQFALVNDVDLPLCLFVFQVDAREGYYQWLFKPVIRDGDHAELVKMTGPEQELGRASAPIEMSRQRDVEKLDERSIDRIVDQVVKWSRLRGRVLVR